MSGEILDLKRDYGTVVPPENGCHYCQDGFFYGRDWRRVRTPNDPPEPKADPMAKARAAKAEKAADKSGAVDDIYDKPKWRRNTPKATFAPKDGKGKRKYPRSVQNRVRPAASTRPADSVKSNEPNLTAWAKGETKILFGTVRDTIRGRFNVVVSNEPDAIEVLIREGVVTAAEIPGYGQSSGPSIAGHADAD